MIDLHNFSKDRTAEEHVNKMQEKRNEHIIAACCQIQFKSIGETQQYLRKGVCRIPNFISVIEDKSQPAYRKK